MKRLLFLFLLFAIGQQSFAQQVYYQINLLQNPATPLDDHPVWIKVDPPSSPAFVHYGRTVNGVYDTLNVPASSVITTVTYDCNGNSYTSSLQMPATGIAKDSITIPCAMIVTDCNAGYAMQASSGGQSLHLADSSKMISVNDAVYRYVWSYNDGYRDTLYASGSVTHNYASAGGYNVCLEISIQDTANDINLCSDTQCQKFAVGVPTGVCASPLLYDTAVVHQLYTIAFIAQTGGTHIKGASSYYEFSFGDGSSAKNRSGYVTHTYPSGGTYAASVIEYRLNSFGDTICVDTTNKSIAVSAQGPCAAAFGTWGSGSSLVISDSSFYALAPNTYARFIIDFGDGSVDTTTSTLTSHNYANPGTYPICYTLQIVDSTTQNLVCSDTTCRNFTVNYNCNLWARDSINYNSLDGWFRLSFNTSGGSGIVSYSYIDFGDGTSQNNPVQNSYFSHTYPAAGIYNYSVHIGLVHTATNDTVCSDSYQSSITVGGSAVSCSASYLTSLNANTVNLTNLSSTSGLGAAYVSYIWDFGDGDSSTAFSPSHTYQQPGTYTLCLHQYVIDSVTNQVICYSDSCVTIQVGSSAYCQAAFNVFGLGGSLINFSNISTAVNFPLHTKMEYLWTFGDGDSATSLNAQHNYTQNGSYTVCLYQRVVDTTNNQVLCVSDTCINISIMQPSHCVAEFGFIPQTNTNGMNFYDSSFTAVQGAAYVQYLWDYGDGNTSTMQSSPHTFQSPGTYNVCLAVTVRDSNNSAICRDTICKSVLITGPECEGVLQITPATGPRTYNLTTSHNFTNIGYNISYAGIDYGDGRYSKLTRWGSISGFQAFHTYNQGGTYVIRVNTYHGYPNDTVCESFMQDTLVVPSGPFCKASYIVDTANSYFGNVYIWNTSSPADTNSAYSNSYWWDFGDGSFSNRAFPTHTYSSSGVYPVCLSITSVSAQGDSCLSTFCDTLGTDSLGNLIYKGGAQGFTLNVLDPNSISLPEAEALSLELYPNPAKDVVQIQLSGNARKPIRYTLTSMNGQIVKQGQEVPENGRLEMDLRHISTGLYIISLTGEELPPWHQKLQIKN